MKSLERARDALWHIPPDLPRDEWVRVAMGAHAAGLTFDEFDAWSSQAPNYDAKAARSLWDSIKPDKGIGAGTLFRIAADYGWTHKQDRRPRQPAKSSPMQMSNPKPTAIQRPGEGPAEVWARCEPATEEHPYVVTKKAQGVPLEGLRVVPKGDPLRIQGESMTGALVVPVHRPDGSISSLQFVASPDTAERLKAKDKATKLNLPGASMKGWHTVGQVVPGDTVYVCEGIGTAWSCWLATGKASVCAFSWGNVGGVARAMRERDAAARLVLVPDVGMEDSADKIAREVHASVARMPDGWPENSDVNDLGQLEGFDALKALLDQASEPPELPSRYRLLTADELRNMPSLDWRVRGVLPTVGVAALYGPSTAGKSFLALDLAAAIAEGQKWFGLRVKAAPVVYAALEGEAGIKLRAQAWEVHRGRPLPEKLRLMLQPFKLTEPEDVSDLAAVVPHGAVVFLDTLNRAAPTSDENSSKDMGEILEAAKRLQATTGGLVTLVHHTGKDATKGLRGHSSLFAALDAAIEVSRNGERRIWQPPKVKDGKDGEAYPFRLQVETLGIDEYGDPITSCVVVPDNSARDVKAAKLPTGGNQKLVLDALRPLFKDGCIGKPGAPPLARCIELEAAISAGVAKMVCASDRRTSRTREALTGLIGRGVLGHQDGWVWMA